jgi:hypothetical protein
MQRERVNRPEAEEARMLRMASLIVALIAGMPLLAPASLAQQPRGPSIPKHPEFLGALAPDNLKAKRAAAPFDITGSWFIDLSEGFDKFRFGPPYPEFKEAAAAALKEGAEARAAGRPYRDSIGQCFPPGMPMMMTRVWPIAMIQTPTAIYMISGFDNGLRVIYLDGRKFSNPDTVVYTHNGESIGRWEGQTLVVQSKYFETEHHWIDSGLPISEQFEIVERMRLINGGKSLEIEYTMTDPGNWVGEWKSTKRWTRQDYTDITEVNCLPDLNDHLPGTLQGNAAISVRERAQ